MCMSLRDTDNIMDEHVHITIMCIQCKHIITSRSESDQQRNKTTVPCYAEPNTYTMGCAYRLYVSVCGTIHIGMI